MQCEAINQKVIVSNPQIILVTYKHSNRLGRGLSRCFQEVCLLSNTFKRKNLAMMIGIIVNDFVVYQLEQIKSTIIVDCSLVKV